MPYYVSAKQLSDAWVLSRQTDNIWIWKLKGNSDVMGTYRSSKRVKPLKWSKINKSKFFRKLTTKKKRILSLIGISNWKAKSYKWKEKEDHYELLITGSYQNSQQDKVDFLEYHLFFKKTTHQILFTNPADVKLKHGLASNFIDSVFNMATKK